MCSFFQRDEEEGGGGVTSRQCKQPATPGQNTCSSSGAIRLRGRAAHTLVGGGSGGDGGGGSIGLDGGPAQRTGLPVGEK